MGNDVKPVEEIIGNLKCPHDFRCYKSGLSNLCKAKDIGESEYLLCLDEKGKNCVFTERKGYARICKCPLRFHIAKEFKE